MYVQNIQNEHIPRIQCKYGEGQYMQYTVPCAPSGASTLELVAWAPVSGQRSNQVGTSGIGPFCTIEKGIHSLRWRVDSLACEGKCTLDIEHKYYIYEISESMGAKTIRNHEGLEWL